VNTAGGHKAGERTQDARPADCSGYAAPGPPRGVSGDHLARYLAKQPGLRIWESLKDVIAPHVMLQPPGERAARTAATQTADQVIWARMDTRMSPGRIGASAESEPCRRSGYSASAFESFSRGSGEITAIRARGARELEAGG
jgi:hypothetical protein